MNPILPSIKKNKVDAEAVNPPIQEKQEKSSPIPLSAPILGADEAQLSPRNIREGKSEESLKILSFPLELQDMILDSLTEKDLISLALALKISELPQDLSEKVIQEVLSKAFSSVSYFETFNKIKIPPSVENRQAHKATLELIAEHIQIRSKNPAYIFKDFINEALNVKHQANAEVNIQEKADQFPLVVIDGDMVSKQQWK